MFDSTINLEGTDTSTTAATAGGNLQVDITGSFEIGGTTGSTITTRGGDSHDGTGGAAGRIDIAANTSSKITGTTTLRAEGGSSVSNRPGNGGNIRITVYDTPDSTDTAVTLDFGSGVLVSSNGGSRLGASQGATSRAGDAGKRGWFRPPATSSRLLPTPRLHLFVRWPP